MVTVTVVDKKNREVINNCLKFFEKECFQVPKMLGNYKILKVMFKRDDFIDIGYTEKPENVLEHTAAIKSALKKMYSMAAAEKTRKS